MGMFGRRCERLTRAHAERSARRRKIRFGYRLERDLRALGIGVNQPHNLTVKHLLLLIEHWQKTVSVATLHNLISDFRTLHEWSGSANRLPANQRLGVPRRSDAVERDAEGKRVVRDEGVKLTPEHLAALPDWLRPVVELEAEFGLRRKEALKVNPREAWDRRPHGSRGRYGRLFLKRTVCKGGRPRTLPVSTRAQADLLERCCRAVHRASAKSMIQDDGKSYDEAAKKYDHAMAEAGLKGHDYRKEFAIREYEEAAGQSAPVRGGTPRDELKGAAARRDRAARLKVSLLLGHGRIDITKVYVG